MRAGTAGTTGFRYAVRRSGHNVACCSVSIACGTRDESSYPAGIAHFTEHTLFRGTRRKSAARINSYLDRLGGELNAYTTKEEIVLHATVLKEDIWKAVGLLLELATEATFPDREIETERGVVLDEIISYKDNPSEDIYDSFEELLFRGTSLETPILGTARSVRKITPEMLRRFVAEYFIPSRMVLSIVADEDEALLERKAVRIAQGLFPAAGPEPFFRPRTELPSSAPFVKTVGKRNHEANVVIGGFAPSLYREPDRIVAAMLANILGGPASNSLLNAQLREKRGLVYGIECSYTQYADSGVIAISFGCDSRNLEQCLDLVWKTLDTIKDKALSDARLKAFRKQMLGQLAISGESSESMCLSMGKSMLSWGKIMDSAQTRALLDAVTAVQIQEMACRLLGSLSTLIYR